MYFSTQVRPRCSISVTGPHRVRSGGTPNRPAEEESAGKETDQRQRDAGETHATRTASHRVRAPQSIDFTHSDSSGSDDLEEALSENPFQQYSRSKSSPVVRSGVVGGQQHTGPEHPTKEQSRFGHRQQHSEAGRQDPIRECRTQTATQIVNQAAVALPVLVGPQQAQQFVQRNLSAVQRHRQSHRWTRILATTAASSTRRSSGGSKPVSALTAAAASAASARRRRSERCQSQTERQHFQT